jgi:hypothetical protein
LQTQTTITRTTKWATEKSNACNTSKNNKNKNKKSEKKSETCLFALLLLHARKAISNGGILLHFCFLAAEGVTG